MSGWASLNDSLRVGDSVFSTAFFPAVSPLPPIAVAWVLADESLAPKCPPILQVDTSGCAHFRHHSPLVTLRLDGTERTLTHKEANDRNQDQLPATELVISHHTFLASRLNIELTH